MTGSHRISEYVYLLWSLIMTGYWLLLYENLPVPAVVPFGIAAILLVLYVWGFLKGRFDVKKIALLLSLVSTVIFSALAALLQPECSCYHFSWADLVPAGISLVMQIAVWIMLSTRS
jgi:hypothetical protein